MKATSLATVVFAAFAALCAFAPSPASAQNAADVYVVAGIRVDETAANAAEAQAAGFTSAQRQGFDRLVRRLTIPEELAAHGAPAPDATALERLVTSVQVEEEGRSGTRYVGRLTVRFDPSGVRTALRGQGLSVVDTRTAPVLIAPLAPELSSDAAALWRQVWAQGGFQDELAPLAVAPETLQGAPDWAIAAPYAQAAAAASVIYATVRVQGNVATAALIEVTGSARRDRGEVAARVPGSDAASLRAAFASLADQATARVQNEWKARIATGGGQRARVSASALYTDERQWERIKQALEGAAQTLISEIRIEAVGREGALVSFSFVGDRNQLVAELARRGVGLTDTAQGPVLRVAGR
jgi:Uncharacterized protein conserved in bacteria (DUF2066)